MNKKFPKRGLLLSAVSLLLCVSMLVGATFAWFTDNATTSVNTIQAGTLDLVLEYKDASGNWQNAEGKVLEFVKASGHAAEEVLWEPGATYNLQTIRVRNDGNLALKFKVGVTGIKGDAKLNEVIEWSGFTGEEIPVLPGATSAEITISGHMQEEAGNTYMGLSIEGATITVYATQYTHESDSFDDQYDKGATYLENAPLAIVTPLKELNVNAASVDDINNAQPLTLDTAYNFTATQTDVEATASDYAKWHADFVVSVDKAVPANALTLAGQYDSWSTNWMAFENPNALAAGEAVRLLETAGASVNYTELCSLVKEFNCGAAATAALDGATMTVELRLYETETPSEDNNNSSNVETGKYITIGNYKYTFGAQPQATVTEMTNLTVNTKNDGALTLDTGYTFAAQDSADAAAASNYANWHADFVVSVDEAVPANALTLAGQYDSWGAQWEAFENPAALTAGQEVRLLNTAGVSVNYTELCQNVRSFNCGAAATDALAGATMTVELRLYETEAASDANSNSTNVETGKYITIGTYQYTFTASTPAAPARPEADVSALPAEKLNVNVASNPNNMNSTEPLLLDTGYTFAAVDTAETAANSPYAQWHADFVVTMNANVPANALTLAGQYDSWSENWLAFTNPAAIDANTAVRLLQTAGVSMTYQELCNLVKEFDCGAAGTDALTGATMTVELRLFETVSGAETGKYEVIGSYTYTFA